MKFTMLFIFYLSKLNYKNLRDRYNRCNFKILMELNKYMKNDFFCEMQLLFRFLLRVAKWDVAETAHA